MRNFINSFLLTLFLYFASSFSADPSGAVKVACGVKPTDAVKVWTTATATIYNVFPIRVGGVQLFSFSGLEDYASTSSVPVCVCMTPIPRVGIKVSLWQPTALAESVKIPWCSPTIGANIPVKIGPGAFAIGEEGSPRKAERIASQGQTKAYSYQVHWWKFPAFAILNLFIDVACMDMGKDVDLAYTTELDPLWQNDTWSAVLAPESILFANPIAQLACGVDSAASNFGFPIDPLWWCMGTWGSTFPITGSLQSPDGVSSSAGAVGRIIMKLHRQFILKGTVGDAAICTSVPMPVWRKSQYGIFPIYPVIFPKRQPIGRTALWWGSGKNIPYANRHNWVYSIYRKVDCCVF